MRELSFFFPFSENLLSGIKRVPKIMSPSNGSQSDIQVGPWLSIDKAVVLLLDTKAKKKRKFSPEFIVFGSLSDITASTEMGAFC